MPLFDKTVQHLLCPLLVFFSLVFVTSCKDKQSDSSKLDFLNTNLDLAPATNAAPSSIFSPLSNKGPVDIIPPQSSLSPADQLLQDAERLYGQGLDNSALEKTNSALQADPKDMSAYSLRGEIHAKEKLWGQAHDDYEAILQIDANNIPAHFNLSELEFMQKNYDTARPGFMALEQDPDWGDLASYKVFLCDLFGGHENTAQSELDAFNKVGSNPSFYFGNAAWYLVHQHPEDARSWLNSGARIYMPKKVYLYSSSLKELGYLPLPPP